MADLEAQKLRAARRAVAEIKDGMVVGLGSGSTTMHAVREIGRRVREEGLCIVAAAASSGSGSLAVSLDIPLRAMGELGRLDLVIDGADEIDPAFRAIKGGGGALFREKILAAVADRMIAVIDSSKPVETLGKFKLPVEVHPFALQSVRQRLEALGAPVELRLLPDHTPFLTDQRANIFDVAFGRIDDVVGLASTLDSMPGIIEHGLFVNYIHTVMIGRDDHVDVKERDSKK